MRRIWVHALVVIATLLLGLPAMADRLSLVDAQSEARAHGPEAAELEARLRGAQVVADDASRAFRRDPSITGAYTPGAITGNPDEVTWQVGLRLPIDISGSWGPRGASAAADRDRTRFDREDGLRALDETVAITVADLALAQRLLARADRVVTLYAVAAEAAHRRFAIGQGDQLEVDAADLDLAGARAAVAQARGELGRARAGLARLLGRTTSSDLGVEDPDEPGALAQVDIAAMVDRDPRTRSTEAELRAARRELDTYMRLIWPIPTLGVDYAYRRRDIAVGSFSGPGASALSANWVDNEVGFSLTLPLPLFDRQTQGRAKASARIFAAEARLASVRADVRAQLATAWSSLTAASGAFDALAGTSAIIERQFTLLDRALRAGVLDAVARTLAIRRLEDAGRRWDIAIREVRVARAGWIRRTHRL